jgi:hypothetical protein
VGAVYADHFRAQHDRGRTFGISTRGKRPHLREDIVLATKLHGKMMMAQADRAYPERPSSNSERTDPGNCPG